MAEVIRYAGTASFNALQLAYKKRYEGHEHDIRFEREQRLAMEVRIEVPHMLTLQEVEKEVALTIGRAVQRLSHELADVFERSAYRKT